MASTRGLDTLVAAGVAHTERPYHHTAKGALPAAEALGVDPARVAKTLVIEVDGEPTFAVLPATVELSLKKAARAAGGKHAQMARPADAERVTGYVTGGISALGSRRPLPVLLELAPIEHATFLVNAGARGVLVEVSPEDYVSVTGAVVADLAAD